jgi:DNA-binding beta-propeller fold protein YncE
MKTYFPLKIYLAWAWRILPPIITLLALFSPPASAAEVDLSYLYNLADFNGAIPFSWIRFTTDVEGKELYVVNPSDQSVSIFNKSGLLVYSFGDEGDFGYISGLALDEKGDMYFLSSTGSHYQVLLANFRGEPKGSLTPSGLPPLFTNDFSPNRIFYRNGRLYLVDTYNFKILITDSHGKYLDGLNFAPIIDVNYKKLNDFTIIGFTIDRDGNYIFTIPVQALVYIISPDGKLTSFGRRGSSPGKFNVIGGVAVDDKGYLYVADTLRCVVMVFDRAKDFYFKGQFGERGWDPGELIAPMELIVMGDFLYVSQSANRGVSVYRIRIQ